MNVWMCQREGEGGGNQSLNRKLTWKQERLGMLKVVDEKEERKESNFFLRMKRNLVGEGKKKIVRRKVKGNHNVRIK
jgi:hypothetical protein